MKATRSIEDFAREIARQQATKRDFIINTNKIEAYAHLPEEEGRRRLELGFPVVNGHEEIITAPLTLTGHEQLAEYCNIPKKYYDLVKVSSAELLSQNVSYWLKHQSDRRMIRILDGQVRGILSDRYRRLDNYDLVQAVLPFLVDAGLVIDGSEITDKKMYLKARSPKLTAEIELGDVVEAGVILSNSEIGYGSLSVKPFIYRLKCKNGAIADDFAMKKYHVGRANEMEQIEFSNETLEADDKAFFLKVRDLVQFSLSEVTFGKIVDKMKLSMGVKIEEPTAAVELAVKTLNLNQTEKENVFRHLIEGGSLTSWGMGNAITRTAHDVESYDRSIELESLGFQAMLKNWN